jgi:hypothetical protein
MPTKPACPGAGDEAAVTDAQVKEMGARALRTLKTILSYRKTLITVFGIASTLVTWAGRRALEAAAEDYAATKAAAVQANETSKATAGLVETRYAARNSQMAGIDTRMTALEKAVETSRRENREDFHAINDRLDKWMGPMPRRSASAWEAAP